MKACDSDHSKWVLMAPLVFWADRVTIRQVTGYSPFFMAHGVEAVLPFNIAEATYLLPPLDVPASTKTLIAHCTLQLLKHPEDLRDMASQVFKARKLSAAQFVPSFHPPSMTIISLKALLSSSEIPRSKRNLTARQSLATSGPWLSSIEPLVAHISFLKWMALSPGFVMLPSKLFLISPGQWTVFPWTLF